MERKNAKNDYTNEQFERAQKYFRSLNTSEAKSKLIDTIVKGLPGIVMGSGSKSRV